MTSPTWCRRLIILGLFLLAGADQGAAPRSEAAPQRLILGGHFADVGAVAGRLVFQRQDERGNKIAEPSYWPAAADSPTRFEDPQLTRSTAGTWLTFTARSAGGGARRSAIPLDAAFAGGLEDTAVGAAFEMAEPAVALAIAAPAPNAVVADSSPKLEIRYATPTGIAIAPESLTLRYGGEKLDVSCRPRRGGADCVPNLPLPDGLATITATIADLAGNVSPLATHAFTIDTAEPQVTLLSPADAFFTGQSTVVLQGFVSEPVHLEVGGAPIPLARDLSFAAEVPLADGASVLILTATDAAGNTAAVVRSGFADSSPPPPIAANLVETSLDGGKIAIRGAAGAAEAHALIRWRNPRNGQETEKLAAADGSFAATLAAKEGDVLVAVAIDALGRPGPPADFALGTQLRPGPTIAYQLADSACLTQHRSGQPRVPE